MGEEERNEATKLKNLSALELRLEEFANVHLTEGQTKLAHLTESMNQICSVNDQLMRVVTNEFHPSHSLRKDQCPIAVGLSASQSMHRHAQSHWSIVSDSVPLAIDRVKTRKNTIEAFALKREQLCDSLAQVEARVANHERVFSKSMGSPDTIASAFDLDAISISDLDSILPPWPLAAETVISNFLEMKQRSLENIHELLKDNQVIEIN